MRRLGLFLALFGVGLAVLWLSDGRSGESAEAAAPPPAVEVTRVAAAPSREPPQQEPLQEPAQEPGDRAPVRIRGRAELDVYAAGAGAAQPVQHHFEGIFEPTDETFRSYVVRDLVVRSHDPVTGALRETIQAARGRFGVAGDDLRELRVADGGRIVLEDVTVVRHVDHPLAPLTVTAPALETFLDEDRFHSVGDEPVVVDGAGVHAVGLGLVYDGATAFLAFERGGTVAFDRGLDGTLRFSTPGGGPIEVERAGVAGSGAIEVRARDGARFLDQGPPPGQVDARTIRLFGRVVDGAVQLDRGVAEGDVVATRGPDRYRGGRATIDLDAAGRVERVVLEDGPRASTVLVDARGLSVPIETEGAGPLTVWLDGEAARFDLVGPAEARAPERGVTVEARGSLEGRGSPDATSATFLARGGVRVRQGEAQLDTEELEALFVARDVDLSAVGPSRLTGRDEAGAPVTVDVAGELEARIRGERWLVPLARGVTVTSEGAEPHRGTAGTVRDLDLTRRTFTAEEGVTWESVLGEGSAQRAEATEDGVLHLIGTAGEPARFRLLAGRETVADFDLEGYESAEVAGVELDLAADWLEARAAASIRLEAVDRTYSLVADFARLTAETAPGESAPTAFELEARRVARMRVEDGGATTSGSAGHLVVEGALRPEEPATELAPSTVVASGGVHVDHLGLVEVHGDGERFTLDAAGDAQLEGGAERPVQVAGLLPRSALPFEATAGSVTWKGELVAATRARIEIDAPLLAARPGGDAGTPSATVVEATDFTADEGGVSFDGDVLVRGSDEGGIPITLRAGSVRIGGQFGEGFDAEQWQGAVQSFEASEGFLLVYGGLGVVTGASMVATPKRAVFVGVEGRPAVVEAAGLSLESTFVDVDLQSFLLACERGVVRGTEGAAWALEFASLRPRVQGGETFFVIVSPRYDDGIHEVRADFASAFLHGEAWRSKGRHELWGEPLEPVAPTEAPARRVKLPETDLVKNVFRKLLQGDLGQYMRAAYVDGNVEVIERRRTVARASSGYLDMDRRHGWLRDAVLSVDLAISDERQERVRVAANEIRTAADGSMRAEKATLTTSKHDEPTYVIETGELVLDPREDGGWRFSARKNRIRFQNGIQLPLPPLGNIVLDEEGGFVGFEDESGEVRTIETVTVGSQARFGTTLGTAFRFDVGKLGRQLGRVLGFHRDDVQGKWYTEGSYLGDRGVLLGVGLELREKGRGTSRDEEFWFNVYTHGINDDGEDRGLERVPVDERDEFRNWTHARGRYPFSDREWIDVAFTTQTDPGVQAEFYQSEYQTYEERDNYAHWRRAAGASYYDVSVKARVDDFRTEVEELPSAGAYWGERKVADLFGQELLYGANLDVDHLNRLEGDLRYEEPFRNSAGEPDGLGDREVLRADTSHRLSLPYRTAIGGLRATPWLEGRATVWDRGVDEDDDEDPSRLALLAGADLATTLHKITDSGYTHLLTPSLTFRTDLAVDEQGGDVVRFDSVDDPLQGDELGVGLRALWLKPDERERLDLELRAARRVDRAEGLEDQSIVAALGEYWTMLGDVPFAALLDLRYDLESDRTLYARETVALQPWEELVFELSYRRGVDAELHGLFETASLDARWRIDPKWEIELGQDIAIKGGGSLKNLVILRRYGADFLLELEVEHRAGEGGTTFAVNFAPLFAWRQRPLGILGR